LASGEKPDCELRGHFAGGHYLSACALAFASSGDEELKRNGDLMVSSWPNVRAQSKNGYLSAFPVEWFDRLRDSVNVWARSTPITDHGESSRYVRLRAARQALA
jgi:DUF1680 family protein